MNLILLEAILADEKIWLNLDTLQVQCKYSGYEIPLLDFQNAVKQGWLTFTLFSAADSNTYADNHNNIVMYRVGSEGFEMVKRLDRIQRWSQNEDYH